MRTPFAPPPWKSTRRRASPMTGRRWCCSRAGRRTHMTGTRSRRRWRPRAAGCWCPGMRPPQQSCRTIGAVAGDIAQIGRLISRDLCVIAAAVGWSPHRPGRARPRSPAARRPLRGASASRSELGMRGPRPNGFGNRRTAIALTYRRSVHRHQRIAKPAIFGRATGAIDNLKWTPPAGPPVPGR